MNEFFDLEKSNTAKDQANLLDDSIHHEYAPIHKNAKLLKFILYTTKLEIKSNSLIKMIFTTSLLEFCLWIVGFMLFLSSPSTMYLIMVLFIHPLKAIAGFILLNNIPKTYEIIENVSRNPNFKEEEIMNLIKEQTKEMFMQRWTDKKKSLMFYFIITIIALIFDVVIFIIQIVLFGNLSLLLMESTMLFIIMIFLGILICFYILILNKYFLIYNFNFFGNYKLRLI